MSIKEKINIVEASVEWLNTMAERYHYMHKAVFIRACPFGWAVTWDGELLNQAGDPYGFIIYASIHYTKLRGEFGYPGLPTKWQVLSLSRLWLHDDLPRNSETFVIGRTLRLVQRRWIQVHPPPRLDEPYHIRKVISYSDTRYHTGTIYRAANFREVGRTKSGLRKSGNRGKGSDGAELICFAYDLKAPKWSYEPPATVTQNPVTQEEPIPMQMSLFPEVPQKLDWSEMVLSVSHDQDTIIRSIMRLHNQGEPFDVDPTYSKGVFYRNLPPPRHKFDLSPQSADVQQADARSLPLPDRSVGSVMFDPPFKVGNSNVRGIIEQRFTAFSSSEHLWQFYHDALAEFYRILRPGGLLVFKCQDVVSSGKNQWSHKVVERTAEDLGFEQVDLFILVAKSVLFSPNMQNQQHARKCHSYFMVFRKPAAKKMKKQ